MTMYHAYELMIRDGLRAFLKFYQSNEFLCFFYSNQNLHSSDLFVVFVDHSDKFWMNEEPQLQTLLDDIKMYLGPFPDMKTSSEEEVVKVCINIHKMHKIEYFLVYDVQINFRYRKILYLDIRNLIS